MLISHIFDAPRELVFKVWTSPEHLMKWYAPRGCSVHFDRFEFRQGGSFLSCIRNPTTPDCLCNGVYLEIVPPERIVYTLSFADKDGNTIEPADAAKDADWPSETVVTVTFAEHQGKTTLTLHQTVSEAVAKRTGAYPSWIEMLERLAEVIA